MNYKDEITLALALCGTVLGLFNTYTVWRNNRVKLKVIPKLSRPISGGVLTRDVVLDDIDPSESLCIEVINFSSFPVVLSGVGFIPDKGVHRMTLSQPILEPNRSWPCKLESRESVTCYFARNAMVPEKVATIKKAYAETKCQHTEYGSSQALKVLVDACKSLAG